MPQIKVNGVSLNYQERGTGQETILFVPGLLFNQRMFDAQVEALKSDYRCIAVDLRGQGDSEVTSDGVIGREGVYPQLSQIQVPTLIVVDEQDVATTKGKSERMHQAISHSALHIIPSAGHSSCVERPFEVTRALPEFIRKTDSEISGQTDWKNGRRGLIPEFSEPPEKTCRELH